MLTEPRHKLPPTIPQRRAPSPFPQFRRAFTKQNRTCHHTPRDHYRATMQTDDRRAAELEELGLTNYEARVYLALIRRDVFTAAEVAREARVPRQRVYDVLDGLTRPQLAVLHPGRVAGSS